MAKIQCGGFKTAEHKPMGVIIYTGSDESTPEHTWAPNKMIKQPPKQSKALQIKFIIIIIIIKHIYTQYLKLNSYITINLLMTWNMFMAHREA